MTMPSSVVTCDQKVEVEPPSLRGGDGVELLQEQASLLGLGGRCSPQDKPVETVSTLPETQYKHGLKTSNSQKIYMHNLLFQVNTIILADLNII